MSLADALRLGGGVLPWSVDCVLCEVVFDEVVVKRVGEEELSLFVECGKGGQPCIVRVERWGGFPSTYGEELCRACFMC